MLILIAMIIVINEFIAFFATI